LNVKRAVDHLVGRLQRYLDLAGIGIDDEGLMLGERGWSKCAGEDEDCEEFQCVSPMVF
jgi:hypothetical protein